MPDVSRTELTPIGSRRLQGILGGSEVQEPPKTLGGEITRLRTEAGLTLKDLAESVGCRSPYIEAIEDGRVEPSEDFVRKLAARLEAGGSLELFRRFRLQEDAAVSVEEIA